MPPTNDLGTTTQIGRLLSEVRTGKADARQRLLDQAYRRFELIARRLLNRSEFRGLRKRGVATHDVVDETLVERIFKENASGQDLLARQDFHDPKQFIGAVAQHMKFCLKDIALGRGVAAPRNPRQKTNAPSKGGRQPVDETMAGAGVGKWEQIDAQWRAMVDSLDQLDAKDEEVFRLRYIVGLSREEVAENLGVSTKYVTRHARKAKEQITANAQALHVGGTKSKPS